MSINNDNDNDNDILSMNVGQDNIYINNNINKYNDCIYMIADGHGVKRRPIFYKIYNNFNKTIN